MRATVVLIVTMGLSAAPALAQQALDGDWTGGIDDGKRWRSVEVSLRGGPDGPSGTIDLPDERRTAVPLTVVAEGSRLHIEWPVESQSVSCEGEIKDGALIGTFRQGDTT